jgi:hypothetical protein
MTEMGLLQPRSSIRSLDCSLLFDSLSILFYYYNSKVEIGQKRHKEDKKKVFH